MSKLLIEQLTEQVELNKTAEEAEFEKIAHVANVVDQAQTLSLVGEELYKIAEELENEEFAALAADIYQVGERMGSCLSKTASDSPAALEEAMDIAEDLNKLASVVAEIADEIEDEDFSKLAEAIIDISNEMTDDANEVMEALEADEVEKEAGAKEEVVKRTLREALSGHARNAGQHASKAAKAIGNSFKGEEWNERIKPLIEHSKATHPGEGTAKSIYRVAKLAPKATAKAAAKAAGPYAGTAAALAAAGYGGKKYHDRKKK